MTIGEGFTALSVRSEAQRTAAPDRADLYTTLSATAESKSVATTKVQTALLGVLADLERSGGQVLTADSTRAALTWSTQSLRTQEEYGSDKRGTHGPTGRQQASVTLQLAVGDFALLPTVAAALTSHDAIEIHSVSWSVDDDHPEWALVRADAIRAALSKGQDYAAALGGTVVRVDHVADAGLLGGDNNGMSVTHTRAVALSAGGGGMELSLDPVPQVLTATIEARFAASVAALPVR